MPKPTPLNYGAVENLTTGLGGAFSKSRQWVPKHSSCRRTRSRLRALYQETIGGMIVDLVVDGVAAGKPIGISESDMGSYRAASKKIRKAWKLGRLYGYAWLDHLWAVYSLIDGVPIDGGLLHAFTGVDNSWATKETVEWQRYESVLVAPYADICLYEACKTSAFETVGEFSLLTMQIPNMLESARDCKFIDSMRSLAQVKSVTGIIPLNEGSKLDLYHYEYDQIINLMSSSEDAIAATARIPKAILFQRSPSGSTSGRFEIVRWYEQLIQQSEIWIDAVNCLLDTLQVESRLVRMDYDYILELYGIRDVQPTP